MKGTGTKFSPGKKGGATATTSFEAREKRTLPAAPRRTKKGTGRASRQSCPAASTMTQAKAAGGESRTPASAWSKREFILGTATGAATATAQQPTASGLQAEIISCHTGTGRARTSSPQQQHLEASLRSHNLLFDDFSNYATPADDRAMGSSTRDEGQGYMFFSGANVVFSSASDANECSHAMYKSVLSRSGECSLSEGELRGDASDASDDVLIHQLRDVVQVQGVEVDSSTTAVTHHDHGPPAFSDVEPVAVPVAVAMKEACPPGSSSKSHSDLDSPVGASTNRVQPTGLLAEEQQDVPRTVAPLPAGLDNASSHREHAEPEAVEEQREKNISPGKEFLSEARTRHALEAGNGEKKAGPLSVRFGTMRRNGAKAAGIKLKPVLGGSRAKSEGSDPVRMGSGKAAVAEKVEDADEEVLRVQRAEAKEPRSATSTSYPHRLLVNSLSHSQPQSNAVAVECRHALAQLTDRDDRGNLNLSTEDEELGITSKTADAPIGASTASASSTREKELLATAMQARQAKEALKFAREKYEGRPGGSGVQVRRILQVYDHMQERLTRLEHTVKAASPNKGTIMVPLAAPPRLVAESDPSARSSAFGKKKKKQCAEKHVAFSRTSYSPPPRAKSPVAAPRPLATSPSLPAGIGLYDVKRPVTEPGGLKALRSPVAPKRKRKQPQANAIVGEWSSENGDEDREPLQRLFQCASERNFRKGTESSVMRKTAVAGEAAARAPAGSNHVVQLDEQAKQPVERQRSSQMKQPGFTITTVGDYGLAQGIGRGGKKILSTSQVDAGTRESTRPRPQPCSSSSGGGEIQKAATALALVQTEQRGLNTRTRAPLLYSPDGGGTEEDTEEAASPPPESTPVSPQFPGWSRLRSRPALSRPKRNSFAADTSPAPLERRKFHRSRSPDDARKRNTVSGNATEAAQARAVPTNSSSSIPTASTEKTKRSFVPRAKRLPFGNSETVVVSTAVSAAETDLSTAQAVHRPAPPPFRAGSPPVQRRTSTQAKPNASPPVGAREIKNKMPVIVSRVATAVEKSRSVRSQVVASTATPKPKETSFPASADAPARTRTERRSPALQSDEKKSTTKKPAPQSTATRPSRASSVESIRGQAMRRAMRDASLIGSTQPQEESAKKTAGDKDEDPPSTDDTLLLLSRVAGMNSDDEEADEELEKLFTRVLMDHIVEGQGDAARIMKTRLPIGENNGRPFVFVPEPRAAGTSGFDESTEPIQSRVDTGLSFQFQGKQKRAGQSKEVSDEKNTSAAEGAAENGREEELKLGSGKIAVALASEDDIVVNKNDAKELELRSELEKRSEESAEEVEPAQDEDEESARTAELHPYLNTFNVAMLSEEEGGAFADELTALSEVATRTLHAVALSAHRDRGMFPPDVARQVLECCSAGAESATTLHTVCTNMVSVAKARPSAAHGYAWLSTISPGAESSSLFAGGARANMQMHGGVQETISHAAGHDESPLCNILYITLLPVCRIHDVLTALRRIVVGTAGFDVSLRQGLIEIATQIGECESRGIVNYNKLNKSFVDIYDRRAVRMAAIVCWETFDGGKFLMDRAPTATREPLFGQLSSPGPSPPMQSAAAAVSASSPMIGMSPAPGTVPQNFGASSYFSTQSATHLQTQPYAAGTGGAPLSAGAAAMRQANVLAPPAISVLVKNPLQSQMVQGLSEVPDLRKAAYAASAAQAERALRFPARPDHITVPELKVVTSGPVPTLVPQLFQLGGDKPGFGTSVKNVNLSRPLNVPVPPVIGLSRSENVWPPRIDDRATQAAQAAPAKRTAQKNDGRGGGGGTSTEVKQRADAAQMWDALRTRKSE